MSDAAGFHASYTKLNLHPNLLSFLYTPAQVHIWSVHCSAHDGFNFHQRETIFSSDYASSCVKAGGIIAEPRRQLLSISEQML